jgi:hypothetical protein
LNGLKPGKEKRKMHIDKQGLKTKLRSLAKDIEDGELKAPEWLWVIGGALTGLLASCLKWKRKSGKPIIARFDKVPEMEENE